MASYGLRKTAFIGKEEFGEDVYDFVTRNFYVDDGLSSFSDVPTAIDLLKRCQEALMRGGRLRLHKISSNSCEVMQAFPSNDLAQGIKDLNFGTDTPPLQRSLGIYWNIASDNFTYKVWSQEKPLSRRGVLSTVNSLYDPLGFLAPVVIRGKWLLRRLTSIDIGWDDPLPHEFRNDWENWKESLKELENIHIPRKYVPSVKCDVKKELHVFSDASKKAIAAVAYLRTIDSDNQIHVSFILGKAKVAPSEVHTIPRMELCAAVLAVQILETVVENLELKFHDVKLYTDSQVVLGYIYNTSKRFYVYVGNRIERIRKTTEPIQ